MREENQEVQQAAEYLNQIPKFSGRKHSMEELRSMLRLLDAAPGAVNIIHVAGTNGKGSVCAFLNSILRTAGYHTAVFTSPHLLSVKERFCFDGKEVEDPVFLNAFHEVQKTAADWEREELGHPTYFEFLFLMFWRMLRFYPVDYVILETGLGGRLDATNCIEQPLLSIITSISRDHVEYLGETIREIAGEKAGIIKAGIPVIYDACSAEAADVILVRAEEQKSPCIAVDSHSYWDLTLREGCLHLKTSLLFTKSVHSFTIPFAAEYQAVNAMLAVRAAEQIGILGEVIFDGLAKTVWPGRMEKLLDGVYIDGAHNEGGIRAFAGAAKRIAAWKGRTLLLFAVASDKDYRSMVGTLLQELKPELLILTRIQSGRGLDLAVLEQTVQEEILCWTESETGAAFTGELCVCPTVREAFYKLLKEKQPEDIAFCTGSLYLAGELKEISRKEDVV